MHPIESKHFSQENRLSLHEACLRIQHFIRIRLLQPKRLHRANLVERLVFEEKLFWGGWRLLNHLLVFALLFTSLQVSENSSMKKGIYQSLRQRFDFDNLEVPLNRDQFVHELLPSISREAESFFSQSSKYYEAVPFGSGAVELYHGPLEFLSQPKMVGGIQLSVEARRAISRVSLLIFLL